MSSKVQNIVLGALFICLITLTIIYARLTQRLDIKADNSLNFQNGIYILKI